MIEYPFRRRVAISKREYVKQEAGGHKWETLPDGEGILLGFAVESDSGDTLVVALIELDDGRFDTRGANLMRLIK